MRHRNNVKQLGRIPSHRSAMFSNMLTSLYLNESIITTKRKAKELKKISEKLITRARRNIGLPETEVGKKLHNKRIVLKTVKNEDAVKKLFDDIAPRYVNRNGGYTRIYLLGRRLGDAAEMAMIELVEKKIKVKKETAKEAVKEKAVTEKKTKVKNGTAKEAVKEKAVTEKKAKAKKETVKEKAVSEKKEKKEKSSKNKKEK